MNNPVFKDMIKYWWAPLSLICLTLIGRTSFEKQALITTQREVVSEVLRSRLLIEKSFNLETTHLKHTPGIRQNYYFCYNEMVKGYILTLSGEHYSIATLHERNMVNPNIKRDSFIVEEGRFRLVGPILYLEKYGSNGEIESIKELKVIGTSYDKLRLKRLSLYGKVLTHNLCSPFELELIMKFML